MEDQAQLVDLSHILMKAEEDKPLVAFVFLMHRVTLQLLKRQYPLLLWMIFVNVKHNVKTYIIVIIILLDLLRVQKIVFSMNQLVKLQLKKELMKNLEHFIAMRCLVTKMFDLYNYFRNTFFYIIKCPFHVCNKGNIQAPVFLPICFEFKYIAGSGLKNVFSSTFVIWSWYTLEQFLFEFEGYKVDKQGKNGQKLFFFVSFSKKQQQQNLPPLLTLLPWTQIALPRLKFFWKSQIFFFVCLVFSIFWGKFIFVVPAVKSPSWTQTTYQSEKSEMSSKVNNDGNVLWKSAGRRYW